MHQLKLNITLAAVTCGWFVAATCAQPTTAPSGLPAGHPDISHMKTAAPTGMPAGHPDISGMTAGANGGPQFPAGHPEVADPSSASTQPAAIGSLTVRAIQGTRDGAPVAGDAVTIELYHRGQALDRIETRLDDKGAALLRDVQVSFGIQPVVKVMHSGLEYQTIGQAMDRNHPDLAIDIMVFDTTEQAPAWRFRARHLMVHPDEHGLHVTEMLVVDNPSDRTWRGVADAGAGDQRATFTLSLPSGAGDLELNSGFDAARLAEGKLVNHGPLVPGSSRYQFSYTVPVTDGNAQLNMSTAAELGHLMVFLPDDGSTVSTEGLESLGVSTTEQGSMRYYKAGPLSAAQPVSMAVSGVRLAPAEAAGTPAVASTATSMLPKVVAGVGGVIVILFGAAFMFIKSPRPAGKRR